MTAAGKGYTKAIALRGAYTCVIIFFVDKAVHSNTFPCKPLAWHSPSLLEITSTLIGLKTQPIRIVQRWRWRWRWVYQADFLKMERAKRFEPSTPTLARLCSTTELRPLIFCVVRGKPAWQKPLYTQIFSDYKRIFSKNVKARPHYRVITAPKAGLMVCRLRKGCFSRAVTLYRCQQTS